MYDIPLIPADRRVLAAALLLWRYVNHKLTKRSEDVADSSGSTPSNNSCERAERALGIAGRIGIVKEYTDIMMQHPVLTVRVVEMGD